MKTAITFISIISLIGCATNYAGPMPNLSKTGTEAQQEIEKFTVREEGLWGQRTDSYLMGNPAQRYFLESLEPLISKVSPDAETEISKAKNWRWAAWVPWAVAVGIIVANWNEGFAWGSGASNLFWGFLAVNIGMNVYVSYQLSDAAEIYNRDLRLKLGFKTSF